MMAKRVKRVLSKCSAVFEASEQAVLGMTMLSNNKRLVIKFNWKQSVNGKRSLDISLRAVRG